MTTSKAKGRCHQAEVNGLVAFLGELKPSATIIDIGAGFGADAEYLKRKGHKVTALEKNKNCSPAEKSNIEKNAVNYCSEDVFTYKSKKKYDASLLKHVDHFYDEEEFIKIISVIRGITKKRSLNAYSLINPSKKRIKSLLDSYGSTDIEYFDIHRALLSDKSVVTVVNYAFRA